MKKSKKKAKQKKKKQRWLGGIRKKGIGIGIGIKRGAVQGGCHFGLGEAQLQCRSYAPCGRQGLLAEHKRTRRKGKGTAPQEG